MDVRKLVEVYFQNLFPSQWRDWGPLVVSYMFCEGFLRVLEDYEVEHSEECRSCVAFHSKGIVISTVKSPGGYATHPLCWLFPGCGQLNKASLVFPLMEACRSRCVRDWDGELIYNCDKKSQPGTNQLCFTHLAPSLREEEISSSLATWKKEIFLWNSNRGLVWVHRKLQGPGKWKSITFPTTNEYLDYMVVKDDYLYICFTTKVWVIDLLSLTKSSNEKELRTFLIKEIRLPPCMNRLEAMAFFDPFVFWCDYESLYMCVGDAEKPLAIFKLKGEQLDKWRIQDACVSGDRLWIAGKHVISTLHVCGNDCNPSWKNKKYQLVTVVE
jgi:hypothetical protein